MKDANDERILLRVTAIVVKFKMLWQFITKIKFDDTLVIGQRQMEGA